VSDQQAYPPPHGGDCNSDDDHRDVQPPTGGKKCFRHFSLLLALANPLPRPQT